MLPNQEGSATDPSAVNDPARAGYHFFFGGYDNFLFRCDYNFFGFGYDRFADFHSAFWPNASGVPDAFGTFNGDGTAGERHKKRSNSERFHFELHFVGLGSVNHT